MKKVLVLLIIVALAATTAFANGGNDAAADDQIVIGMTVPGMQFPFFIIMGEEAQAKADSLGIKLIIHDSQNQSSTQMSAIENFIAQKVDGILMEGVNRLLEARRLVDEHQQEREQVRAQETLDRIEHLRDPERLAEDSVEAIGVHDLPDRALGIVGQRSKPLGVFDVEHAPVGGFGGQVAQGDLPCPTAKSLDLGRVEHARDDDIAMLAVVGDLIGIEACHGELRACRTRSRRR